MSHYHILTQPDTVLAAVVQGQEREEVATSPTPGLAPTKNIAPNKSVGSSWRPVSAFKQSRFMHTMPPAFG